MQQGEIAVIKVRDVLMVTLPANPGDHAIASLQEEILKAMQTYEAKGLVLDISAVEIFDSYFARLMGETAQMVTIMGGRTVIAGMRPSVAITVTELGLSLGNAMTALNVERALDLLSNALSLK